MIASTLLFMYKVSAFSAAIGFAQAPMITDILIQSSLKGYVSSAQGKRSDTLGY